MRNRSTRSRALLAVIAATTVTRCIYATTYTDATGDVPASYTTNTYMDIDNVVVTNDATNVAFQINLISTANLNHVDASGNFDHHYGKYQIGIQTGANGNTAILNNYGNPIGISTGVDYSLLGWADNIAAPTAPGGSPQGYDATFHWNGGGWDTVAGFGSSPFVDTPTVITDTSLTYTVPLAALGLNGGSTFKFDVWSAFGGNGGAYDALDNPNPTNGAAHPWEPTPYDSATAAGSTLSTYTVTSAVTGSLWSGTTDGNWSGSGNWTGSVPNAADQVANFGSITSGNYSVALDGGGKTVGTVNLDSATSYTLGTVGGNALTFQVATGTAGINVISGNHTIAAPVTLSSNLIITTGSASTLSITSPLLAAGKNIAKAGSGTIQLERVQAALLDVTGGTVRASAKANPNSASGTSFLDTLFVSAGATLDLTNNALVNNYTTVGTLPDTIRQMLLSGRISTSLNTSGHTLGYADNATLGKTTFGGQPVSLNSVLIGYTYAGDANLDGRVNAVDFNALASGFGSGTSWVQGDFSYNGVVDSTDFTALSNNFGKSLPAAPGAGLGTLVPEPVSIAIPVIGMLIASKKRRRRMM